MTKEIEDLKREIECEQSQYETCREYPTETDQFYRALEKQRQRIETMRNKLLQLIENEKQVEIEKLKEDDKGRWVEYTAPHGAKEKGKIKSWNETFVFVVYKCADEWDKYQDYTGVATNPKNLKFV